MLMNLQALDKLIQIIEEITIEIVEFWGRRNAWIFELDS